MSSRRIRKAGIPQMCDKVAPSSPKGRGKGAMVKKEGTPKNTKSPPEIKDFCVRVQNCCPILARRIKLQLLNLVKYSALPNVK